MFAYLSQSSSDVSGYAIVTDRFLCLLGHSATAAQASELYVALDSDSVHLDGALSAIIAHYSLTDFAIVEVLDPADRRMTVAVQGDVVVDVEGATGTRLSGPTGATWVMGEVKGVTALSLSLAGASDALDSDDEALPLRRGVVRAAAVALNHTTETAPALAFIDEQSPHTVQMELPRNTGAVTPIAPRVPREKAAGEKAAREKVASEKAASEKAASDKAARVTIPSEKPPRESVPRVVRATPAKSIAEEMGGVALADRGAMRIDLSAEAAGGRLGVQLSDGNPFAANIPLVFGRRPWSTELDTSSIVSIALESPLREISAIHLEIAEIGGRLQARDLNSTNGTVVMSPGRPSWLLSHGKDTVLENGDVLDLGEGSVVKIVALDGSVYHRGAVHVDSDS